MIKPLLARVFAQHELAWWEYDVLAALRRSGDPHQLTAGQLLSSLMITSGAVTNRLDRLEKRGLIKRGKDPKDGRLVLATLTPNGLTKINAALVDHAANELELIQALDHPDRETLIRLLRTLHEALADRSPASASPWPHQVDNT